MHETEIEESEEELTIVCGEQRPSDRGKKTLVLDLDETLVHSSF
jgi:TFIIF-interacting CTD phosphatase-like protein